MNSFQQIFDAQKQYFSSDITKPYEWRIEQLNKLETLLTDNAEGFYTALGKDFKTCYFEQAFEILGLLGTIAHTKAELKNWMRPEQCELKQLLTDLGHTAFIHRQPYGVTLIIGPFNSPLILLLEPAIAALAAGNTCILKPAASTAHTTSLFAELIAKYFEPEAVTMVSGNREVVTGLLQLPFDFIFFTGSTNVGRVVMLAAAENLTPVLLELGGQNATIVDETANLPDAAEKIGWGFTALGGQWCVSPGYVYVHESVADAFVEESKKALIKMYGEDAQKSNDLSKIITEHDVERIMNMVDTEKIVYGGSFDKAKRYIEPTLVYPSEWTDKIMDGEIFGPVLPILVYSDIREAVQIIKSKPKGLAAYIFSRNQATIDYILNSISFGGGCINQANIHCWMETMPFGGVGTSGIGRYYGKYGFEALSNPRNILYSSPDVNIEVIHPPYNEGKLNAVKAMFKA
ncbi:MAG: aldehyde dehydrogenase family protein [Ferruginibacter sp.]